MNVKEVIRELKRLGDPSRVQGMESYGIRTKTIYGVRVPDLRSLAKNIGKDHAMAIALWEENSRETRILASMVDDPKLVSVKQMEWWVGEFDNWEVCDQCIMNLFEKMDNAWNKALEWAEREEEFQKRAGFVMMARLAVSDKKAVDDRFLQFFPLILKHSFDDRVYVKKAINWAVRQIGKRNSNLNAKAIELAREVHDLHSSAARWIASDALKELTSEKVQQRLKS